MVGAGQKGKLSRIPHRIKIDLSEDETSPPTKRRLEMGSPSEKKSSDAAKEDAALLLGLKEKQAERSEPEKEEEEEPSEEEDLEEDPSESEDEEEEAEEEERPAKWAQTPVAQRKAPTPMQTTEAR